MLVLTYVVFWVFCGGVFVQFPPSVSKSKIRGLVPHAVLLAKEGLSVPTTSFGPCRGMDRSSLERLAEDLYGRSSTIFFLFRDFSIESVMFFTPWRLLIPRTFFSQVPYRTASLLSYQAISASRRPASFALRDSSISLFLFLDRGHSSTFFSRHAPNRRRLGSASYGPSLPIRVQKRHCFSLGHTRNSHSFLPHIRSPPFGSVKSTSFLDPFCRALRNQGFFYLFDQSRRPTGAPLRMGLYPFCHLEFRFPLLPPFSEQKMFLSPLKFFFLGIFVYLELFIFISSLLFFRLRRKVRLPLPFFPS